MSGLTGRKDRPRGRRSGSSDTRSAILAAATRRFATDGYPRTSLRAVAADAGVDQRLVSYFFGTKQQLFIAAVGMPFNPADIADRLFEGDLAGLRERIAGFLFELFERGELHERLTAVVLASASEANVARAIGDFLSAELEARSAALPDLDHGALRLNLVGATIVGLVLTRYVSKLEPIASMSAREVAEVVAPTIERYLVGSLTER